MNVNGGISIYNGNINVSGAAGGTINLVSAGSFMTTGTMTANGAFGQGGIITVASNYDLSVGFMEAAGNTNGGVISLLSRQGTVTVGVGANQTSIIANGIANGGVVRMIAGNGITVNGTIDVSSLSTTRSGNGGEVELVTLGASGGELGLISVTRIFANAPQYAGSIAVVSASGLVEGTYDWDLNATGPLGQGGNLFISLGTVVVLVTFALLGKIPLPVGVVGHEGSTVVVVMNSLRLLLGGTAAKENSK